MDSEYDDSLAPAFESWAYEPYQSHRTRCIDGVNSHWKPVGNVEDEIPPSNADLQDYLENHDAVLSDADQALQSEQNEDPEDVTTIAPAFIGAAEDDLPPLLSLILPPKQEPASLLFDPAAMYMQSMRTGRAYRDFGDYLPNCICSEVEGWQLAMWIQFGATLHDVIDRIKPLQAESDSWYKRRGEALKKESAGLIKKGDTALRFGKTPQPWANISLQHTLQTRAQRWRVHNGGLAPAYKSVKMRGQGGRTGLQLHMRRLMKSTDDSQLDPAAILHNVTWSVIDGGRRMRQYEGAREYEVPLACTPDEEMTAFINKLSVLKGYPLKQPNLAEYLRCSPNARHVRSDDDCLHSEGQQDGAPMTADGSHPLNAHATLEAARQFLLLHGEQPDEESSGNPILTDESEQTDHHKEISVSKQIEYRG